MPGLGTIELGLWVATKNMRVVVATAEDARENSHTQSRTTTTRAEQVSLEMHNSPASALFFSLLPSPSSCFLSLHQLPALRGDEFKATRRKLRQTIN